MATVMSFELPAHQRLFACPVRARCMTVFQERTRSSVEEPQLAVSTSRSWRWLSRLGMHNVTCRLVFWTALIFVAASLQGCLPPDWSFCDCDFRDNFWNHVLNDVHMLWDGPGFVAKARDNTTFQGKYLSGPMPEGYDCPMVAAEFWKGWPRFGMTRGLIEGSMGDLWMPAARDRIKGICMAGHFWLTVLCSQHFLVQAGKGIENGEPDHMKYLEAAYSHMVAIRNMGQPYQLRNCMGQQGWPPHAPALHAYAEKWLGREASGTNPMAAYMGGRLDPYQMLYDGTLAFTERSRKDALPDRRPCVPFKEPKCWKRMSKLLMDTCEYCCSPFDHRSGRGWDMCFDDVWTFERCCNHDFKDLVCSLKRKGEEGGCVDCKKSVEYTCLTPPEKHLQDAQANYNAQVDRFNVLQKEAQSLKEQITQAQSDLYNKDVVYREKWTTYDQKLRTWSVAFNNQSRLISQGRLDQQHVSYNMTAEAHLATTLSLRDAQESLRNATTTLEDARLQERRAEEALQRNESELDAVRDALANQRERLTHAQEAQQACEEAFAAEEMEVLRFAAEEAQAREQAVRANRSRDEVHADVAHELRVTMGARAVANESYEAAFGERDEAHAVTSQARSVSQEADKAAAAAASALARAEQNEAAARQAAELALEVERAAQRVADHREEELANVSAREVSVHLAVMALRPSSEALRCLISRTPANTSARPRTDWQIVSLEDNPEAIGICMPPSPEEDDNEFCAEWASDGQCVANSGWMLKHCQRSCHGKDGVPAPAPVCPQPGSAAAEAQLVLQPEELKNLVGELIAGDLANDEEALAAERSLVAVADEKEVAARKQVDVASAALRQARERARAAATNVVGGELAIKQAQKVAEEASQKEEMAKVARAEAEQQVLAQSEVVRYWESVELTNITLVDQAAEVVKDHRGVLKTQRAAVAQALELEQGLDKGSQLAEESAAKARETADRAKMRVVSLGEHIDKLNSTINENLTMIVTDWLQAREAEEESKNLGWGRQLLKAARSVLVSLVSSIEAFLDTYVMSMTDKESVIELIHAVEDYKAAKRRLQEEGQVVVNAEKQARDAAASLSKAQVARRNSEQAANQTEVVLAEANAELQAMEALLNATRQDLNNQREQLNATQLFLDQREKELDSASAEYRSALDGVEQGRTEHRRLLAAEAEAKSSVVEAGYGLSSAEAKLNHAAAAVVEAFFAHLRQECGADDAEFQVYIKERPLLSLLRSAILGRQHALTAARSYLEESTANKTAAEASRDLAQEETIAATEALRDREASKAAASEDLRLKEAVLAEKAERLALATAALEKAQEALNHVLGIRREADMQADTEVLNHMAAAKALVDAHRRRELRDVELRTAVNNTGLRAHEVGIAEVREVRGEQAVEAAKTWLAAFVESLEFDRKEKAVTDAKQVQTHWEQAEDAAARYKHWQKGSLDTHIRHLKLLDKQVELKEKEDAKLKAQTEHAEAEKAVVSAQEHLDTLFKNEAKTQADIGETHQKINELWAEHSKAQDEYNKQDPKDRERSFSTKLEGAGPDPNGIDVR